ncbi:hypothetical protein BZY95_06375 [Billgrantia desiderata SP1]|uniref:hypothetical protein n=1 Tax=Billgrantia desiderata TaxID=52021 RepID=UPI000A39423F|nr:hypothetical protein [Halomonas desiderata]OUE44363.1 hypothetical protein BZY95_06375 [Halomonas desiderata SP1]
MNQSITPPNTPAVSPANPQPYQEVIVGDIRYEFPADMPDEEISAALRADLEQTQSQPQVVTIRGQEVRVPEGMTPSQLFEKYHQYLQETGQLDALQPQPLEGEATPRYQPFGEVGKDIDPATLVENEDWLRASAMVYQLNQRKPFDGSPEELSDWARSHMAWFNYNIFTTGMIGNDVMNADQTTKEAFLYLMDTFDNTNMSWQGAKNTASAIAMDPSTYAGLSALGLGNIVKFGAGQAGKAAFRQHLVTSVGRTGIVAGVEGGIYMATDDAIRQGIEVSAGRQEEYDLARGAGRTALGAAAGLTLGTGLDMGLSAAGRRLGGNPAADVAEEALTPEAAQIVQRSVPEALPPATAIPEIPTREVAGFTIPDNPGMLNTTSNMGEVRAYAEVLSRQLEDLPPEVASEALTPLMNSNLSLKEFADLKASVQLASNRLTHRLADVTDKVRTAVDDDLINLQREQGDLIHLQAKMEQLDHILRSDSGRNLRARQEGETDLNDLSFEKVREVLKERGLDNATLEDAVETEFLRRYNEVLNSRAYREKTRELDTKLTDALLKGDMQQVTQVAVDKRKVSYDLMSGGNAKATIGHKLAEGSIANVFSATTLAINAAASSVKGLVVPGMRALLSNPLEKATRAEMAASYSAMRASLGMAWRASKAAWRYEQAIMSHDPNRFLESHLAIGGGKVSGKVAPYMRFFLRGINATDEFLSRIYYDSYVAGRAASEAAIEGARLGHTGNDLDKFIQRKAKEAVENAYKVGNAEAMLDPILRKGENLGLRGKELEAYLRREAARDPEILKRASNEEGLDYIREVLYKRAPSGENMASHALKGIEDTLNRFPMMKIISGQLFLRTPIRVIEEGLRFVPGLNYALPNFMADLSGNHGAERQIKARGEALMSFTFAAVAASLWAQGKGRGDGGYDDWRQGRLQRDSHMPDPYTILMDDGSTWNYRFFDPVATPLKVMFNAFERFEMLRIREAQGEFVDKSEFEKTIALVSAASMGVLAAVRDANLLTGVDQMIENVEMIGNPEDSEALWVRNFGERIRLLVPNTLHKANRTADPEMPSPATFLQMAEQQLLRPIGLGGQIMTAKSYDHLGRVRTVTDVGSLHNIFSTASEEERQKGRSETELFIDEELVRLQRETGLVLRYPYQHRRTGTLDLRTVATADGNETLYDRWNHYYSDMLNLSGLEAILRAPLPEGTYRHKAAKVERVRDYINAYRDAAFERLFSEEQMAIDRFVQEQVRRAETEAGLWDADRKTVRQPRFETPWSQ